MQILLTSAHAESQSQQRNLEKAPPMQNITSIFGHEPMRRGEEPEYYRVGVRGVTRIDAPEYRNAVGNHWFTVWVGDKMLAQMQSVAVSTILYDEPSK